MARRLFAQDLSNAVVGGVVPLSSQQAHHAVKVLRMPVGQPVELFDASGLVVHGVLQTTDEGVGVVVEEVVGPSVTARHLTVAAAVPKGDRADWMVEKLSELGVETYVPLACARSVVVPEGVSKLSRWHRIAQEAAKQSRRTGVMSIDPVTPVAQILNGVRASPGTAAPLIVLDGSGEGSLAGALADLATLAPLTLAIGPEGGWTEDELAAFRGAGAIIARLGPTTLRMETAAVVAAGIVMSA